MTSFKIAIIGAGPVGLTLARLLQLHHAKYTVLERETGVEGRNQGGTIDLHHHGGQLALKEAGLLDEFRKHSRPEGEASKIVKFDGTVLFGDNMTGAKHQNVETDRPEIDRKKLRALLLESLEPGTIVYWKTLQCVDKCSTKPSTFNLHFQQDTEEEFDLVVGADGVWSKVRRNLTDRDPFYSGVSITELSGLDIESRHSWLNRYVGAGSVFMFDEGRMIICQRNGEDSIRVHAGLRQPESWVDRCGIDWSAPQVARTQLIEQYFANCGEGLTTCSLDASDELVPRPAWMSPVSLKWTSRPGVTLIGDSAHLMTPAAGIGVNLATIDAFKLAKAVVGCAGELSVLPEAIRSYEEEMLSRAEKFAKKTLHSLEVHLSATAGEERAALLKSR